MTTLTLMQTGVWDRLGVQSTDGVFTAAVVTEFINDALREIATEHDWPWLQASEALNTVAGQSYVTPAEPTTSWTGTRYATVTSGGTAIPLSERTFTELLDAYQTTGRGLPREYCVEGERLELRPIPDGVYVITHGYVRAEKVLASGSDTPLLPDAYAPAAINLAVANALGRSKEDARAVAATNHYANWLAKMLDNRRRTRKPGRIRVRPGCDI